MTYTRSSLLVTALLSLGASRVALAQAGMATQSGFNDLGSDTSLSSSPGLSVKGNNLGVKLGDGAVLHVGIGAAGGYDSNVFYDDQNPVSSPIVEVVPFLGITNAGRNGAVPSGVAYDLGVSLQYREYVSEDPNVQAQRSFNPIATGSIVFASGRTVSYGLSDQFTRQQEPPYGPSTGNITRNYNLASAHVRVAPGGGRIAGLLRYSNSVEYFENPELDYATVVAHEGMLDLSWRWLPKTGIFVQASQGYVDYLNEDPQHPRSSSYPFKVIGGIRGLVTSKLAVNLGAGYAGAYYQGDASEPSGLSNLAAVAELLYTPATYTRMVLGYRHEFRNSPVIGNFYNLDSPYFGLRQMIAGRLQLGANVRYELRRYDGVVVSGMPVDRNDNTLSAGAMLDYFIQQWFYAGVSYTVAFNNSDLDIPGASGLDYTKHTVFGRLGFAY